VGAYGLSGLLAGLGCLLAEGFFLSPPRPRFVFSAALLTACLIGFGFLRIAAYREGGVPLTLALIQGNVRQDVKWEPRFQQWGLDRHLELSREALASSRPRPDALIWPETSVPFIYRRDAALASQIDVFAALSRTPILFGGPGLESAPQEEDQWFNRAFFLDPSGGVLVYDKQHLVPFGEYIPPVPLPEIFASLLQGLGGFTPGLPAPPFPLELSGGRGVARLGALICYEAIFPELARQRVADGATVLVNISNDAWYERSAAPVQHLHLALLRAVEQNRWLARSTNTGLTAFVDPLGRVTPLGGIRDGSALFTSAFLTGQVNAVTGHTPYFFLHPRLPALAFPLLLLIVVPVFRRGTPKKTSRAF
jgi:apolipoprotein N-acyltransferase